MEIRLSLILKYKDGSSSSLIYFQNDYEYKILKNKPLILEYIGCNLNLIEDRYDLVTNQYTLIYGEI